MNIANTIMGTDIMSTDLVETGILPADRKTIHRAYLQRIGNNIRRARHAKGLSLRALSRVCTLDYSDIGKIEKGRINIGVIKLLELARALEVEPASLLRLTRETESGTYDIDEEAGVDSSSGMDESFDELLPFSDSFTDNLDDYLE